MHFTEDQVKVADTETTRALLAPRVAACERRRRERRRDSLGDGGVGLGGAPLEVPVERANLLEAQADVASLRELPESLRGTGRARAAVHEGGVDLQRARPERC